MIMCVCLLGRLHAVATLGLVGGRRTNEVQERACGLGLRRSGADSAGKDGDNLQALRHGTDHVDAFEVHQLAQLLEGQVDLAAGEKRSHRYAGRRLYEALLDRLSDAPSREELLQRDAARSGGIAQTACCEL